MLDGSSSRLTDHGFIDRLVQCLLEIIGAFGLIVVMLQCMDAFTVGHLRPHILRQWHTLLAHLRRGWVHVFDLDMADIVCLDARVRFKLAWPNSVFTLDCVDLVSLAA